VARGLRDRDGDADFHLICEFSPIYETVLSRSHIASGLRLVLFSNGPDFSNGLGHFEIGRLQFDQVQKTLRRARSPKSASSCAKREQTDSQRTMFFTEIFYDANAMKSAMVCHHTARFFN
jgi:hypothetical protein